MIFRCFFYCCSFEHHRPLPTMSIPLHVPLVDVSVLYRLSSDSQVVALWIDDKDSDRFANGDFQRLCCRLRQVSPIVVVDTSKRQVAAHVVAHVDAILPHHQYSSKSARGTLVARLWRQRLGDALCESSPSRIWARVVNAVLAGDKPVTTVTEVARALSVSREYLSRQTSSTGNGKLRLRLLLDAGTVVSVLAMRCAGVSARNAPLECGISYRTYLRAKERLQRLLGCPVDDMRALLILLSAKCSSHS